MTAHIAHHHSASASQLDIMSLGSPVSLKFVTAKIGPLASTKSFTTMEQLLAHYLSVDRRDVTLKPSLPQCQYRPPSLSSIDRWNPGMEIRSCSPENYQPQSTLAYCAPSEGDWPHQGSSSRSGHSNHHDAKFSKG